MSTDYDEFKEIFRKRNKEATEFNTDSRQFRRRWDADRIDSDTAYRDSVRRVIIDSLQRHDPEFREKLEERRRNRESSDPDTIKQKNSATRDEKEEHAEQEEGGIDD